MKSKNYDVYHFFFKKIDNLDYYHDKYLKTKVNFDNNLP